jgi:hypothetical protein
VFALSRRAAPLCGKTQMTNAGDIRYLTLR